MLNAYLMIEVNRFERKHKVFLRHAQRTECTSILLARFVEQANRYEVAGPSGANTVAWHYANFHHTQIRAKWADMRCLAFADNHEVSIESFNWEDSCPDERKKRPPTELQLRDDADVTGCHEVFPAMERILNRCRYGPELRRALSGEVTASRMAALMGHPPSWFSACVTGPFICALQDELRRIGIEYKAGGKTDFRVLQRSFQAAMAKTSGSGDPLPMAPVSCGEKGKREIATRR